ncbi:MAG: hypothetical protein FJ009_07960 [Chloroflexi bacterium]|nr:hypothetical protein [Chloroflexota bacterium]
MTVPLSPLNVPLTENVPSRVIAVLPALSVLPELIVTDRNLQVPLPPSVVVPSNVVPPLPVPVYVNSPSFVRLPVSVKLPPEVLIVSDDPASIVIPATVTALLMIGLFVTFGIVTVSPETGGASPPP